MNDVARHYGSQGLVDRILAAVPATRQARFQLGAPDLYPFDQLHGRELLATKDHAERLAPRRGQSVLDIGSGIGGPARYLATTYGCHVEGIDLTPEFVEAATDLSALCRLADEVHFARADATSLPFDGESFDAAVCFYVGMNLPRKAAVVAEAFRVLRRGGRIVWTEAVLSGHGEPVYPLPWAQDRATSFLVGQSVLEAMFREAGFTVEDVIDETEAHVELARQRAASGATPTREQQEANAVVLGPDHVGRRRNYIQSLSEGSLASQVIVARAA
jgi:SAM-dependent methyltransferase